MAKNKDLWAIGDTHGVYLQLLTLLDRVEARSPDGAEIVFLGDYVDRGPRSLDVVRLMMAGPRRKVDEWVYLRGNHEQMMLDAIAERATQGDANHWLGNGGIATINSFTGRHYEEGHKRLTLPPIWFEKDDGSLDLHKIEAAVPRDIAEWTGRLPYYHRTENHFFAHAGAERGLSAEEQEPYSLLWMRHWEIDPEQYSIHGVKHKLDAPEPFEWHVVYGHTPRREPLLLAESSGLDTGAVFGWGLTAARFDRNVKAGPTEVLVQETPRYY